MFIQKILTILFCTIFLSAQVFSQCSDGEIEVMIEVMTDNYPQEIYWELSVVGGETIGELTAGTYNIGNTLFQDTFCAPDNSCLELEMGDTSGEGICCAFGNGFYNIYIDGELVFEGDGNYQSGIAVNVGCNLGESCTSPIEITGDGFFTAPETDTWYMFVPDTSGSFAINACDLTNECNTAIWIYEYCLGLDWDDTPKASMYFSGTGCDDNIDNALLNASLAAGETYYIRVGSEDPDCDSTIEWQVSYSGPSYGCTDPTACNYDPNANFMEPGSCIYPNDPDCPAGPDLVVLSDVLQNSLFVETNDNNDDCFIEEGCMNGYGIRDLLRFTTHIENIGEQDYYVGAPPTSPENSDDQWEWDPCHGHWHYEGYAEYILYDENLQPLPIGFKNGFCLLDLDCSYGGGIPKYSCSNQGLSSQCGDIYESNLDCQWIDITDIPDANYTLVVRVNWDQTPDAAGNVETNYDNNWGQACIEIYTDAGGFRAVNVDSDCETYVDCLGELYGDAVLDCLGDCAGVKKQGDINNDLELNNDDIVGYMNQIIENSTEELIGPCFDLNADEEINVADVALLVGCSLQDGEPTGGIDYCQFPQSVINIYDTVALRMGEVNLTEQYLDIEMSNPNGKVMAFQFELEGLTIASIEPIDSIFGETAFQFQNNETGVLAISTDMEALSKNSSYYPIIRVHFVESIIGIDACIANITSIVNDMREETMTQITCPIDCGGGKKQGDINADLNVNSDDINEYINNIIDNSTEDFLEPCFDLNADNKINVTDVALLVGCTIQSGDFFNEVDYCQFPHSVTNDFDTVALRIGEVNIDDQYLDIEMNNPTGNIIAFQFELEGLTIESIEAMEPIFGETTFYFQNNETEILAVSAIMEALPEKQEYAPIIRVHFAEPVIGAEACIANISSVVNEMREETMTKIQGDCQLISPFASGIDDMSLPNLQVSPNPFTEIARFNFGQKISGTLEILDIKGQLVQSIELKNQSSYELKRNKMVAGVYMFQVKGDDFNQSGKLYLD